MDDKNLAQQTMIEVSKEIMSFRNLILKIKLIFKNHGLTKKCYQYK